MNLKAVRILQLFSARLIQFRWVFIFLLLSVNSSSQEAKSLFKWSKVTKDRSVSPFMIVGGDDNKMIAIYKERKKTYFIKSYNYGDVEEKTYSPFVLNNDFDEEEVIVDAFFLNGKVYILVDHYYLKENQQNLDIRVFNLKTNSFENGKVVSSLHNIKTSRKASFESFISRDSTRFIVFTHRPFNKREKKAFDASLVDLDLNVVWSNEFKLPYGGQYTDFLNSTADTEGNLFITLKVSPERNFFQSELKERVDQKFVLLSYFWKNNVMRETDINIGDKWISELIFGLTDDNKIVVSGFYSEDQFYSVAGSFYLRMDPINQQILASGFNPIDGEIVTNILGEKKAAKGKEIPRVTLKYLLVDNQGDATLIGEQFWVRERSEYDLHGGYYTRSIYYYMDLILIRYDEDGNVAWTKSIPKRQESIDDEGTFSSIAVGNRSDWIYIVFNDNPKNKELLETGGGGVIRNFNITKSSPSFVSIDPQGNMSRRNIFKDKKEFYILQPRDFMQTSEDQLVLLATKNGLDRFCFFDLSNIEHKPEEPEE